MEPRFKHTITLDQAVEASDTMEMPEDLDSVVDEVIVFLENNKEVESVDILLTIKRG